MSARLPATLAVILGLAVAQSASAQVGTVRGTVTDATSGRALESVQIQIIGQGFDRTLFTNAQGMYLIIDVPSGVHELRATVIGYVGGTATVEVTSGEVTEASFALEVTALNIEGITGVGTAFEAPPISMPAAVAVSTRDAIIEQGSPQITDFFKGLSASHGVIGERNSWYNSTAVLVPETAASVNLRGLGASRTLVLLNGRRQTYLPARLIGGRFVDVNAIPAIALDRIEVLKEGASAVYGSDAVAGVANFVTRGDYSGYELSVAHDYFAGGGDTNLGAIFGGELGEGMHGIVAAEWARRRELRASERDWGLRDFVPGGGGWSGTGNPGVFLRPTLAGGETGDELVSALVGSHWGDNASWFHDPACADFGGYVETWTCRFRYQEWDNLVEDLDHYRAFGELSGALGENAEYRLEGLLAQSVIPGWRTTPSFPPISPYDGTQLVAPNHPGRQAFCAQGSGALGYQSPAECLEGDWFYFGRLVGNSGPGRYLRRSTVTHRLAAELQTEIEAFGSPAQIDLALSYSGANGNMNQPAEYHYRKFLAFRGFGGPNCGVGVVVDPNSASRMALGPLAGASPGQGGCLFYNPFSNALQHSAQPGARFEDTANPNYRPELANDPELLDWINEEVDLVSDADMIVADASISGTWVEGVLSYAFGYQFRNFSVSATPNDAGDLNKNPCAVPGDTGCLLKAGPYTFTSGYYPYEDAQGVHRVFAEFPFKIGSRIEAQAAANYEYQSLASSFDPKFAMRARLSNSDSHVLSLRGSIQSTFRTPSVDDLNEDRTTELAYIWESDTYKALDRYGSEELRPESAFTFNTGLILLLNRARFTVDYWSYDFSDIINTQPYTSITRRYAEGGASKLAVQDLVSCPGGVTDGSCDVTQLERVRVGLVNWPGMTTSGIDFHAESRTPAGTGELVLGLQGTYTLAYDVKALDYNGIELQPAIEGVGALNGDNPVAWPLPTLKGRAQVGYHWDGGSVTAHLNHIGSYIDQRYDGPDVDADFRQYRDIDAFTTLDLNLRMGVMDGVDAVVTGFNLFDSPPPLVNWEGSFDGFTHDPKGRRIKVALSYRMGG